MNHAPGTGMMSGFISPVSQRMKRALNTEAPQGWEPVSIGHFSVLRQEMDLSDHFMLLSSLSAVALCEFFDYRHRPGETTVATGAGFRPQFDVLFSVKIGFHTPHDGTDSASFPL